MLDGKKRPSEVCRMLRDDGVQVDNAPPDDDDDDHPEGRMHDSPPPKHTYNFAPGNYGIVYRAEVPEWGAGPKLKRNEKEHSRAVGDKMVDEGGRGKHEDAAHMSPPSSVHRRFILHSMKWGLVPFWTKRTPDYAFVLRTINCRDESLISPGGLWQTMKARKRCVVLAQGFYEWLAKAGGREKVPHFVKRKDGKLMCFAGLWDCVLYEDGDDDEGGIGQRERKDEKNQVGEKKKKQKNWTYTIITTSSNELLRFLHDRMPVILEQGSQAMRTWLDPGRYEWDEELQALLRPYEGELDVYPVSKEVGKVGNNSPSFVVPIASRENKANIANFFANAARKKAGDEGGDQGVRKEGPDRKEVKMQDGDTEVEVKEVDAKGNFILLSRQTVEEASKKVDDSCMINSGKDVAKGIKRGATSESLDVREMKPPATKKSNIDPAPGKSPSASGTKCRQTFSATSTSAKIQSKGKQSGSGNQKITKYFGNSS